MFILAQLPTPPAGAIENALITSAAIGSIILIAKKLLPRKRKEDESPPNRLEFHLLRERVDALSGKLDSHSGHMEQRFEKITSRLDEISEAIHQRLGSMEAGLARVDERTRRRSES
jgi:hypothetical protein